MVAKVTAGGLSAGVFLLWWPTHFPDQGLEWLVLRGVLWTLAFELLVLSIDPVERRLLRRVSVPRPGRRLAMLGAALAVIAPVLLLTDAKPVPEPEAKPRQTTVVKRVVVRKPVVRREVVVREVEVPVEVPVKVPVMAPDRAAPKPEAKREKKAPAADKPAPVAEPVEDTAPEPALVEAAP
jgi:hypothetical protein